MNKILLSLLSVFVLVSCAEKKNSYDPEAIDAQLGEKSVTSFEVEFKGPIGDVKTIFVKFNGSDGYDALFDTGCFSLSISALEFERLKKAHTIDESDYLRDINLRIADGSVIQRRLYNIKTVSVTDKNGKQHDLSNIQASVDPNAQADILVGSAIIDGLANSCTGSYTVDLNEGVIRFE